MNENSHKCVFCGEIFNVNRNTHGFEDLYFGANCNGFVQYLSFKMLSLSKDHTYRRQYPNLISVEFFLCPGCNQTQIVIRGLGISFGDDVNEIMSYPLSTHKNYSDDVIPEQIKEDYEEACSIVSLSPKSSATLSRRVIEGVLTNFFGMKKGRLVDKINNLEQSQKAPDVIEDLNKIRQIGNIATHFNQDQNTMPKHFSEKEAKLMIKSIEYIFEDTYIARNKRESHRKELDETLSSLKK